MWVSAAISKANSGLVLALVLGGFVWLAMLELRDRRRRRAAEDHDRSMQARKYRGFLR